MPVYTWMDGQTDKFLENLDPPFRGGGNGAQGGAEFSSSVFFSFLLG